MKRSEFIEAVAYRAGMTPEDCEYVIEALSDVVAEALANEEKVILRNFVTFEVVKRSARRGRDPKTGNVIEYPETMAAKCRLSQKLKDAVNGSYEEDYGSFRS